MARLEARHRQALQEAQELFNRMLEEAQTSLKAHVEQLEAEVPSWWGVQFWISMQCHRYSCDKGFH